ncbi:MAG: GNAT family N-acetyltransferase [Bacteroidota bacterium]|nr:GNAT family N-acetyltransferase [Bacteroidota bacterium]
MCLIEKATLADVAELNQLINNAYRGDEAKKGWTNEAHLLTGIRIDEEELTGILKNDSSFFLKYSEEKIIKACVLLEKHDSALYLGMLSVMPGLQGKGIGKQLLKAAEINAHKLGCNKIYMTVISVRYELIEWYKRHGYFDTGIKKPFPGEGRNVLVPTPLEFIVLEKKLFTAI